jgi:hypothetical protein
MNVLPGLVQRVAANLEQHSTADVLRFTAALLECSRELLMAIIADKTIRVDVDTTYRAFIRNLHDRAGEFDARPIVSRGQA